MARLHPALSDTDNGGLLLVDKPVGWSSFDVVKKMRGAFRVVLGKRTKVGHGGTLDPLASGLHECVHRACRVAPQGATVWWFRGPL